MSELTTATLADFNHSTQRSSLDTAFRLHGDALDLWPPPQPDRIFFLDCPAAALYASYLRIDATTLLNEAISLLFEAIGACHESDTI
jgi:hypothetical protein